VITNVSASGSARSRTVPATGAVRRGTPTTSTHLPDTIVVHPVVGKDVLNIQRFMYNEKAPNDGHRRIILSIAYRDVGISVISDLTHKRLWITEDYGHS
jgi:hypothetical protein